MKFGICTVSIMPMRLEPNHRSEMVNQVLFGESIEILDINQEWSYIRLSFDHYQGWVQNVHYTEVREFELKVIESLPNYLCSDLVQVLSNERTNQLNTILLGSCLPGLANSSFKISDDSYRFEGSVFPFTQKPTRQNVLENAMMYLNAPYLWGGKSPFGVDCSGFTQMVYKLSGYALKRDASQQVTQGETINFITDSLAGDLAFFDNEEGKITHVGILLGDNKIIHASGKVRIDAIDHNGIYNVEKGNYSHNLRIIKQFLSTEF